MTSYRLGVPVKILGAPLPSHDSRRWQNAPHLSVSLAYLRDIIAYLDRRRIRVYRLAGQLAPYLTHPTLSQFHRQLDECALELAATGDLARAAGIRLTMHPGHYVQLASPDFARVARSQHELTQAARLLTAMGVDDDGVIVIHVGGRYDDPAAGRERFVRSVLAMDAVTRRRLVLENDDRLYDLEDVLWIHRRTGLPVVLDVLHHRCRQSCGRSVGDALAAALATWPPHRRPKIHLSTSRTALRHLHRDGAWRVQMPLPNQHSDFINPFECIDLLRTARALGLREFDVMLEAKAKDLALLRLREQIARYAPELAPLVG